MSRSGRTASHLRIGRALRLVYDSSRGWTLLSVTLALVLGLLPVVSLYVLRLVIDQVGAAAAGSASAAAGPDRARMIALIALIALLGGVTLATVALRSLATLVQAAQSGAVTDRVQALIHAGSIRADLQFYESSTYFDRLHRAQRQAPSRPALIVRDLLDIARSAVSLIAVAGLLAFSLHWGFAVALGLASLPGGLVGIAMASDRHRWMKRHTTLERWVTYFNWVLTSPEHAKELRLFDIGGWFESRSAKARATLRGARLRLATRRAGWDLAAQSLQTLVVFGSLVWLARETVSGALTVGALVMYFQALQRARDGFQVTLRGVSGLYESSLFLSSLDEFLALEPTVRDVPRALPAPRPLAGGITLKGVGFAYPRGEGAALYDIDMVIRPGERIALVGENGAGKSTLIKLLCRLYDPTSGAIYVDGVDLREHATADWRRQLAVVFQDFVGYQLTARENIRLGDVGRGVNDADVVRAARQSGADDFLSSFKAGYDAQLGHWFDTGRELSAGQWQKIALARAFLRQAQVLILDEPTSSLDPKAEHTMFERFHELAAGRTAILISHKLSTVKMADRIYVMDRGRIVEAGTHADLMRSAGHYAELFERQATRYRS